MKRVWLVLILCTHGASTWCQLSPENADMVATLKEVSKKVSSPYNPFASEARLEHFLKEFQKAYTLNDSIAWQFLISNSLVELGEEAEAIRIGEEMLKRLQSEGTAPQQVVKRVLGMSNLRLGERVNCIKNHTAA